MTAVIDEERIRPPHIAETPIVSRRRSEHSNIDQVGLWGDFHVNRLSQALAYALLPTQQLPLGKIGARPVAVGLLDNASIHSTYTNKGFYRGLADVPSSWETPLTPIGSVPDDPSTPTVPEAKPANPAAQAVEELKTWLGASDNEVARLCEFSRRTLTNWRAGMGTYSASSRKLFSIHAFVTSLVARLGVTGARLWLAMDDGLGRSRQEALHEGDASVRRIFGQSEAILFGTGDRGVQFGDLMHGLSESEMSALIAAQPRTRTGDGGAATRPRNPD